MFPPQTGEGSLGLAQSFEDFVAAVTGDLADIQEHRGSLVLRAGEMAAAPEAVNEDDAAALRKQATELSSRERGVNAGLAVAVADIATAIEAERLIFEHREVPQGADVFIGYFSKNLMRRRIELRSTRSGSAERLRLALGRADRLAGLIEAQRSIAEAQLISAEEAYALWRSHVSGARGRRTETDASASLSSLPIEIRGFDHTTGTLAQIADLPGAALGDYAIMLQKLSFDVEHLLDLHCVLTQIAPNAFAVPLAPDVYPHYASSVRRLQDGILPGARLDGVRQAADVAFHGRFGQT